MVGRRISCTVELAITAGLTGALEPQVKTRSAAVVVSKLLWLRHQSLLFSGRRPTGRCAVGPSDRTGRGRKGNDTHEGARRRSPSSQVRAASRHLLSHRGGGRGNTSGTERRPRRAGGGRVSGEEKSRSVASHHRSRRVRGITRSWLDVVADASSPLICRRSSGERDACAVACQCVTGGGGGRDENKR